MIKGKVQCSPFKTLYLKSIGMGHIKSESCYKGTILQRNCRTILQRNYRKKMTILGRFRIILL